MTTQAEEKPLYLGHRARLKERFMVDNGASMPDYELLELLLTMAIPRRDVKPLAKKLISKFGSLGEVIQAPAIRLLDEAKLGVNTVVLLKAIASCMSRISYAKFADSDEPVISSWEMFEDYCWQIMGCKEVQEFRIFFFDSDLHYKGSKLLTTGTINKVSIHPREVVKAALENNAVKVILAHNHPSGEPKPSEADKRLTRGIEELAEVMDFELYDHVIVGKNGIFSFRNAGYIRPKKYENNI